MNIILYAYIMYGIFPSTEAIAQTPRDDVLVDIDDKEPLIPGQVWLVFFYLFFLADWQGDT